MRKLSCLIYAQAYNVTAYDPALDLYDATDTRDGSFVTLTGNDVRAMLKLGGATF